MRPELHASNIADRIAALTSLALVITVGLSRGAFDRLAVAACLLQLIAALNSMRRSRAFLRAIEAEIRLASRR